MSSKIRSRLTYSNVMSTIAVFGVVAGGTALGLPGKGSVDRNDLRRNVVKSKNVKNGGIKAPDLGAAAVIAGKIGVGAVDSDAIDDNSILGADILDGDIGSNELNPALQPAFMVICPGGTAYHEGVCIEVTERTAGTYANARADCTDENGFLPELGELMRFRARDGITVNTEWTNEQPSTTHAWTVADNGTLAANDIALPQAYRCVFTPGQG